MPSSRTQRTLCGRYLCKAVGIDLTLMHLATSSGKLDAFGTPTNLPSTVMQALSAGEHHSCVVHKLSKLHLSESNPKDNRFFYLFVLSFAPVDIGQEAPMGPPSQHAEARLRRHGE